MKRLTIILFVLLLGAQQTFSQQASTLESFRKKVFSDFSTYFNQAEMTENGKLNLSATEKYTALYTDGKKLIIEKVFIAWPDSLVLVHFGSKREVWGRCAEKGSIELLDTYDLNAPLLARQGNLVGRPQPWFFYIGGQLSGDNQHNINIALNLRVGFFLLLNHWDLAATFSGGVSGNTSYDNSGNGWANVGLMSRVHFPIKKIKLSPNIGGEVTVGLMGGSPVNINAAIVVGLSWYVGFGSLNIGVSIGNSVTGSGGLTVFPGAKSRMK
jgi:hypothetical protein